jgi:hypothetical protein
VVRGPAAPPREKGEGGKGEGYKNREFRVSGLCGAAPGVRIYISFFFLIFSSLTPFPPFTLLSFPSLLPLLKDKQRRNRYIFKGKEFRVSGM